MSTSIKTILELPLLNFFVALGEYDRMSLGREAQTLDEYLPVLEILDQGIGLVSKEELYTVCKLLWFKAYHTEKAFRQLFETYLADLVQEIRAKQAAESQEASTISKQKEATSDLKEPTDSQKETETEESEADAQKTEEETKDKSEKESAKKEDKDKVTRRMQKVLFKYNLPQEAVTLKENKLSYQDVKQKIYQRKFILRGDYFPLKSRQMQQSFQLIREVVREGRKDIIDWDATIQKTAKEGLFTTLERRASTAVRSGLTIFVDHDGSMVAFEELTNRMVEAMQQYVGKKTQVYYFQNCPHGFLYQNKDRTQAQSLSYFTEGKPRAIIVVSDAGAARGGYNPDRLKETQDFIQSMGKHRMVWLNPMPIERWKGTTADYVRSLVSMYELNERGFVHAIKALKHRHRI